MLYGLSEDQVLGTFPARAARLCFCRSSRCMNGAKAGWQRETFMKESALKALAAQARLGQLLPLAMFNAADLEAVALEGLI